MQAGAVDYAAGVELHRFVAADLEHESVVHALRAPHRAEQRQHRTMRFGVALQREHQAMAVDDAGGRRKHRRRAMQRGLQRGRLGGAQPGQVVHTAGPAALHQRAQRALLRLFGGHHQLAATAVRDTMGLAVVVEQLTPAHAQSGLQRPGRVVKAGVDDLAIARAGTGADGRRGFEHDHLASGQRQRTRHGQADDAGTDHHTIDSIHHFTRARGRLTAVPRRRIAAPWAVLPLVEGQPLFAQAGVGGGESFQPAQMLDPAFVDEVLDVSTRRRGVAEQPPRQGALAQPRATRLLHHLGKTRRVSRVDPVLHRHHHRAFVGADVDGHRSAGSLAWPG